MKFLKNIIQSKVGRTVTSLVGGLLGLGGGLGAGLEIEFAVLVAATMFVAIFAGVEKSIKFFEAINKARKEKK